MNSLNQSPVAAERVSMHELENGFAAKFPFEIKDDFRGNFPSATWNSSSKQWEVGPRSGKRLAQWIETVKVNFSETIDEYESRLLSEKELNSLLAKLTAVNKDIDSKTMTLKDVETSRREIESASNLLASRQDALTKLKEKIDIENKLQKAEMDMIKNQISNIINVENLKFYAKEMSYHIGLLGKPNKEAFHNAQEEIQIAQKRLRTAGLKIEAIERLSEANKNRPDRDHPKYITEKMWYQLSEYRAN